MLNHLNDIAAGLLGLQGYPVTPFRWSAETPSAAPADNHRATTPRAVETPALDQGAAPAALHC